MDEERARHLERELSGGRTVVSVHAGDRVAKAMDILRDHGAISVHAPGTAAAVEAVRPQ
jgi:hypothetical protein